MENQSKTITRATRKASKPANAFDKVAAIEAAAKETAQVNAEKWSGLCEAREHLIEGEKLVGNVYVSYAAQLVEWVGCAFFMKGVATVAQEEMIKSEKARLLESLKAAGHSNRFVVWPRVMQNAKAYWLATYPDSPEAQQIEQEKKEQAEKKAAQRENRKGQKTADADTVENEMPEVAKEEAIRRVLVQAFQSMKKLGDDRSTDMTKAMAHVARALEALNVPLTTI